MTLSVRRMWWAMALGLLVVMGCGSAAPPATQNSSPPSPPSAAPPEPVAAAPQPAAALADPDAATAPTPVPSDIWGRLQQADTHYYVLMRHALAPGTGDPANFQLEDCTTQRNLSAEGRAQAQRTGQGFRDRQIAVQQVRSSQWCRCLETAELLELGTVEPLPALNSFFQNRAQGPERTAALQAFMVSQQDTPGVTVLVTHFVNISAVAGSGVSSGAMVVMTVGDSGEPEVVGQIEPF